MSPEWEIFFRKSMELSYGVPEGVNGTRKNLSLVAWTACSYLRRLRSKLHVYGTGKTFYLRQGRSSREPVHSGAL